MQDEPSFLVLDSTLVFFATYLLTIFHPGIFFPQMRTNRLHAKSIAKTNKEAKKAKKGKKGKNGDVEAAAVDEEVKATETGEESGSGHKTPSSA